MLSWEKIDLKIEGEQVSTLKNAFWAPHNSVQLYHHFYLLSISFQLPTTDHKTGANSTKTKILVTFLQFSARTFRLEKDISDAYATDA